MLDNSSTIPYIFLLIKNKHIIISESVLSPERFLIVLSWADNNG